jgi:hypothetical protein
MHEDDPSRVLVDLEGFEYIAEAFNKSGKCESSGMGASVLSWGEIKSFNDCVGFLNVWELNIIRRMSSAYVHMLYAGEEHIPSPYYRDRTESENIALAKAQKAAFAGFDQQVKALKG